MVGVQPSRSIGGGYYVYSGGEWEILVLSGLFELEGGMIESVV